MTSFRPGHNPPQVTMPGVCFGSKNSFARGPASSKRSSSAAGEACGSRTICSGTRRLSLTGRRMGEGNRGSPRMVTFMVGSSPADTSMSDSAYDASPPWESRPYIGFVAANGSPARRPSGVLPVFFPYSMFRLPSAMITFGRIKGHDRAGFGPISQSRNSRSLLPGDDVVWCLPSGINPALPRVPIALVQRRQFEVERFPVRVQDQVEQEFVLANLRRKRQTSRVIAPVRLVQADPVPGEVRFPEQAVQARPLALVLRVVQQSPGDEQLQKTMYIRVLLEQRPVEPTGFVVLAIGVIVAARACAGLRRPSRPWGRPARAR